MRIGVIHTLGSPCQCAEAVSEGLRVLGHEVRLVNSEDIGFVASRLARECDLVIDHTDTYRGQGLLRPLVRMLLESRGARIVGSGAQACFLADDKVAAKAHLGQAGVTTPPGTVIESKDEGLPSWLRPPLILKPAFEHMSRGLKIARTEEEARSMASILLESLKQPIIVESFIPGRELAVSLLDLPHGLEVLPILEWRLPATGADVLTEASKLRDIAGERRDAKPADLSDAQRNEIEGLARWAFQVLGLRDYGRFDLRLSDDGTVYFLEANTTPSLEPLEALALSAR